MVLIRRRGTGVLSSETIDLGITWNLKNLNKILNSTHQNTRINWMNKTIKILIRMYSISDQIRKFERYCMKIIWLKSYRTWWVSDSDNAVKILKSIPNIKTFMLIKILFSIFMVVEWGSKQLVHLVPFSLSRKSVLVLKFWMSGGYQPGFFRSTCVRFRGVISGEAPVSQAPKLKAPHC